MNTELQQHIEHQLQSLVSTNNTFKWQPVAGGSINKTYKITTNTNTYFIKTNTIAVFKNGFKEEVLGLQFLEKNKAFIPKIIAEGSFQNDIFLILEWIEKGKESNLFWDNFAQNLANLHTQKGTQFGLEYSNFMGQLHQNNSHFNDFTTFFIENRLKPQVKLAFDSHKIEQKHLAQFEILYTDLNAIFPDEKPAAIHGDLWSGNYICSAQEKAILIDPAVYYGHREIDIAMTQLFGGFPQQFYKKYNEIYPLAPCFNLRTNFYNLYPLLVHLNLFGNPYLKSIEDIITKF
ncbi:fructosamine kinase family protein [Lutibacter holmesii]|uniref:Fructosamine kinase family protein n=1 Tax=Lutibacter holmesii TaxID=1137985 RepID=A0ABW3WL68_9FLAO